MWWCCEGAAIAVVFAAAGGLARQVWLGGGQAGSGLAGRRLCACRHSSLLLPVCLAKAVCGHLTSIARATRLPLPAGTATLRRSRRGSTCRSSGATRSSACWRARSLKAARRATGQPARVCGCAHVCVCAGVVWLQLLLLRPCPPAHASAAPSILSQPAALLLHACPGLCHPTLSPTPPPHKPFWFTHKRTHPACSLQGSLRRRL